MLTKRFLAMTATGLLTGYLAAGQTTARPPASSGADILFWVLVGVLGLVVLLVVVTGASAAVATSRPHWQARTPADAAATTSTEQEPTVC